jgi:hypothetical protein
VSCKSVMALCDECELVWANPRSVLQNATVPADGSYPTCPGCRGDLATGHPAIDTELENAGLAAAIAGQSG